MNNQSSYCIVNRSDFSDIALTVLDAMCDLARKSNSLEFKDIALMDITNHIVNFYFVNFHNTISLEYLEQNTDTDTDITKFKPLIEDADYYKKDFELYKLFRYLYTKAVLAELEASDVIQLGYYYENNEEHRLYVLKQHMLDRKLQLKRITNGIQEINAFGLGLLSRPSYIFGQIAIKEVTNEYFVMEYGNLCLDLHIGLLAYIAIGERYCKNPEQVIYTLLKYIEDELDKKEGVKK